MWTYNQTPRPDELYHYGVPGMKWGHRRARRFYDKSTLSRNVANDYKRISKEYDSEGKTRKAKKAAKRAAAYERNAADFEYKAKNLQNMGAWI